MQKFIQNPYPPLKPPTWKKSSNPHEKTKPKNLKQINTHKEKQTEVREKVIWMVLFPTLLATKHTKKNHQLLQFCNPWPDLFHNLHASTRQWSFDMVTLVPCDGGDARVDLLRVQRHAQQHEESPQGIHELD